VKKVYVQSDAQFRMLPDDINRWFVRNNAGSMVPFSAFSSSHWESGSPRLERYDGYSAVEIVGEAAPGVSTGTAMDTMEKLVQQLPSGFGLEWTAMSYQERLSGAQALPFMHSRCWWSSSAWLRFMKAGLCRSPSCWLYRLA
jgi:multidrug efflux pump